MRGLILAAVAAVGMAGQAGAAPITYEAIFYATSFWSQDICCKYPDWDEGLRITIENGVLPDVPRLRFSFIADSSDDFASGIIVNADGPITDLRFLQPLPFYDFAVRLRYSRDDELEAFGIFDLSYSDQYNEYYYGVTTREYSISYGYWEEIDFVYRGYWKLNGQAVAAIPLPAAGLVLPAGLGALALLRRRVR